MQKYPENMRLQKVNASVETIRIFMKRNIKHEILQEGKNKKIIIISKRSIILKKNCPMFFIFRNLFYIRKKCSHCTF